MKKRSFFWLSLLIVCVACLPGCSLSSRTSYGQFLASLETEKGVYHKRSAYVSLIQTDSVCYHDFSGKVYQVLTTIQPHQTADKDSSSSRAEFSYTPDSSYYNYCLFLFDNHCEFMIYLVERKWSRKAPEITYYSIEKAEGDALWEAAKQVAKERIL